VLQPDPAERRPLVAWLLFWAVASLAGITAVRAVLSVLQARWRAAGRLKQLVAVYGTGELAERLLARLAGCTESIEIVGVFVPGKDHEAFGGLPLLDVYNRPLSFGQTLVKSAFDRFVAALAIVLLSPLLLAVALAIRLDSKGPVLFRQNRFGFGDRVIGVYKFRTMKAESADTNGAKQTEINDPRITRIGGPLRRLSIDELPQLFNVLESGVARGDPAGPATRRAHHDPADGI
jgi:hypothetical protein